MNPIAMMQMKGQLEKFKTNHPKVLQFLAVAGQNIGENSVIEVKVTSPDGKELCTNMKVTADDLELLQKLQDMAGK